MHAWTSGAQSDEELDAYDAINEELGQMWHDSFPNIIRATVLLTACSRLETALTYLCRIIEFPSLPFPETHVKIRVKWLDVNKDRGVYRAKRFFQQNFGIEFDRDAGWSQIKDSYQVRNAIIHAGGELRLLKNEEQKKTVQALKRLHLTVDSYGRIELSESFLESLLETMIRFWDRLRLACADNSVIGPAYWPDVQE